MKARSGENLNQSKLSFSFNQNSFYLFLCGSTMRVLIKQRRDLPE